MSERLTVKQQAFALGVRRGATYTDACGHAYNAEAYAAEMSKRLSTKLSRHGLTRQMEAFCRLLVNEQLEPTEAVKRVYSDTATTPAMLES